MNPSYKIYDPSINKTISFREVDVEQDLQMVHQWMHEEHVIPYWQLNLPFEAFRNHLEKAAADSHQTLYIGEIDGVPVSYWEAYWVKGDIIEKSYNAKTWDQGVHLLIGDKAYLGKGFALPLLRAMVRFQFTKMETAKVIAEPDIRNDKIIYLFKKCGFEEVKQVKLPDKTGLLMFCRREAFEKRWLNV